MRGVDAVRFHLDVVGPVTGFFIRRAEGVATAAGEAEGTAALEQSAALVEFELIVAGGEHYLKGPTGGWQRLPSILADQLYNPASLLDPDTGLASGLERVHGAMTEAAEEVDDVSTYRVRGRVPADFLGNLLPLEEGQDDLPAVLWIGQGTPHLIRSRVEAIVAGETDTTTLTLTLSDHDIPIVISPPA